MQPEPAEPEPSVFSSGYLIFRKQPQVQFLLMKHHDRWDLPKGHLDDGESKKEAAVRELLEETGLQPTDVWTDPDFLFSHRYWVAPRKAPTQRAVKELTIYLGVLLQDRAIECTEHLSYQWWDWQPPHHIQTQTIDPLLESVDRHVKQSEQIRTMLGLGRGGC